MINLFQPSPCFESINYIKNIFTKKFFHKDKYCNLFLEKFSQFQNLKKNNLTLAASCSEKMISCGEGGDCIYQK